MRVDNHANDLIVSLVALAHVGNLVAPRGAGGLVEGRGEVCEGRIVLLRLVGAEGVECVLVTPAL